MDRASAIFCVTVLAGALLIAALAFPYAAVSREEVARAKTPRPAEEMGEIDLGAFGRVGVLDLMTYYMENPPAETGGGEAEKAVRFQGC